MTSKAAQACAGCVKGQRELETSFKTLRYEEDDGVAVVTLDRPEVHNAFNLEMQEELGQLWRDLRGHDAVRAIILTGAGDKAFCSGIDRDESIEQGYLEDVHPTERKRQHPTGFVATPFQYNDPGSRINPKQNDLWKPVVAAVNGMACGGALYLLGESDIVIAAEHATFFDPHVTYGMVAGFESLHLLQKLPLGETLRIALLGAHERMSAARAHQLGLVSEVVPRRRAARAGHVGGPGHRLRTGDGRPGDAPCGVDGPRGGPARGPGPDVEPGALGDRLRRHRERPAVVPRWADRLAAALNPRRNAPRT